jgi:hypothetical protein
MTGVAYRIPEKGLAYIAGWFSHGWDENHNRAVSEAVQLAAHGMTGVRTAFLNRRRYENPGHLPLCLTIRDPEAAFAFYSQRLAIMVLVDVDEIITRLAALDIRAVFNNDHSGYPFHLTDRKRLGEPFSEAQIGDHFFARLFYDFLRACFGNTPTCRNGVRSAS